MALPAIVRFSSSSSPDDLSVRLARGEHDAVVEAYREHHRSVRAFAQRLIGDHAIAEDLVHEVFVALPAALARFRGECSLKSFAISIAIRHAQHHVRAAQRRRAAEARLAHEAHLCAGGVASPAEELERAELARALLAALDELPIDQRVAFVLCEVEERTSSEAAEILGEKDGTVRARVMLAKQKLRTKLEGER